MAKFRSFPNQPTLPQIICILAIVFLSLAAIWWNAIKYSAPLGYAGMYAQLAEQIADGNFRLPVEIEYYGSGGVPAAFPPLGMYVLAFYLKLGGPIWTYFRFMPAVLSTVGLVALFILVHELTSSRAVALLTILLTSSSPYLYSTHTTAAGSVRGLAFVFGLFYFYFYIRATRNPSGTESLLAGILLSLTALTHLSYAFFFVLWSFIWVIVTPKRDVWLRAISIGGIAAILTLPWALLIVSRHGWQVFFNALGSHGTLSIFEVSGGITALFELFSISISEVIAQPALAVLALIGVAFGIRRRYWFLLLAFLFTSLFSLESRRFMVVLGCIFAAVALTSITGWILKFFQSGNRSYFRYATYLVVALMLVAIYGTGLRSILEYTPSFSASLLETAGALERNSPSESIYVILADHHEAEWFPFLAKRNPLFGFWGGEWDGTRSSLSDGFFTSMNCGRKADMECLKKTFQDAGESPQYLVVMKKRYRKFLAVLETQPNWQLIFKNTDYEIWEQDS